MTDRAQESHDKALLTARDGLAVVRIAATVDWGLEAVKQEGSKEIVFARASAIVLACGIRTSIRNSDWRDDIALFSSAITISPQSFKTHKELAYAFYCRYQEMPPDRRDHSDVEFAIQEGQKALAVLEAKPLPEFYQTSMVYLHLGVYYRLKGDIFAQRNPEEGRLWYQKSLQMLKKGIPADRALNEGNRTKELARGRKPDQIADVGDPNIYAELGVSYARLGQYPEALQALLYRRHLASGDSNSYADIASIYMLTGQRTDAAVALLQALLLDDGRKDVLQSLVDLYRQVDDQRCAIVPASDRATPKFNVNCPLVHRHLCSAYLGLVQVFLDAKQWGLARKAEVAALNRYDCGDEQLPERRSVKPTTKTGAVKGYRRQ